ncbi:MAG TPA: hypothetical protein VJ011_01490, partial [Steroidobacteraceae bacterium]|nr:hypothetical protein [Steroidobacteraceae bacterium]
MLSLFLVITLGSPDVGAIEQAYAQSLSYAVVERGHVTEDLAAVWNASRMAGRELSLMKPASGANVYLRFVQVDAAAGYVPMKTFGWNAIEILVQDPDGLAERLGKPDSPFRIVGPPRPLGPNSPIRAMQVVGPANEVLYLTRIPAEMGRHTARTYVDRPFIMIVGGPDLEAMRGFYGDTFRVTVSPPSRARMTVLNKAHGFDIETTHPLSMARLSPEYAIEIDGYPQTATARATRAGELPAAVATVGFEVDSLGAVKAPLVAPARVIAAAPYDGRRVGVVRGAAGELL